MTSIHTNIAAMSALSTLRAVSSRLAESQAAISTGLRIREASDNAAYWSIGVSMRSQVEAMGAVRDALGLAAALVEISYAALDQTRAVLEQVKARLVLAQQPGVDLASLQLEIGELARQTVTIANSASFAGTNWLVTDIADIHETDLDLRSVYMVSSYGPAADGSASIGTMGIDLHKTSLYNADGGGILQSDPRSPGTAGGIRFRYVLPDGHQAMSEGRSASGSPAMKVFTFSGPIAFGPGDEMSFSLTVDADNPAHGIAPPYAAGATVQVAIDRATVDAALPGAGGVISSYQQMASVLSLALAGTGATATLLSDGHGGIAPDVYAIVTRENSGLDGSSVAISGFMSSTGDGGLSDFGTVYAGRMSSVYLHFEAFKVYQDVTISFGFSVNRGPDTDHVIDRGLVDAVLGKDDGRVDSPAEMAALLEALIGEPGLLIEASAAGVTVRTDPATDRLAGGRTSIGFSNVTVNIEPIAHRGLLDIDVAANPHLAREYLETVEGMIRKVIAGAALLGALKSRVEMQDRFTSKLRDAVNRGIGQLLDADMDASSARLKALQAQQQLGLQALAIANDDPQRLLQLFRRDR